MASPSASSAASDLLGAALSDADRRDREALNLKMEIAHLRERLLLRVGGDASAAALEQEAFALRTALADAQRDATRAQQALQALDAKYAKALRNLVKMDQAWKSSAAELAQTKQDAAARDAQLAARDAELAALQAQHESDAAKRQTLVAYQEERIAALEASVRAKESELAGQLDQVHKATLRAKELESELEATRARHESGSATPATRVVARDEFEALQTRHQEALEAAAAVRGETNALREERASLQRQLGDTKASLAAAMAKFLQLKEEHATLEVRVAAAHEASEQGARDAAFYKREVDRVQGELTKRDEEALQLERAKQVLELQLAQQQRLAQDAVQVRDHEAKRLELQQELSWKDREFALENEVRALQKQCAALEADVDRERALHDELCGMLVGGGIGRDTDGHDLKSLVALAVELHSEAAFTAEQQQKQVNRLEKEAARMKALVEENATLKAEYEKTRLAMERIVGRKSKATANTQRFATGTTSTSSATPPTGSSSSVVSGRGALSGVTQRRPFGEKDTSSKAASSWMTTSSSSASTSSAAAAAAAAAAVGTKRRLDMPSTSDAASSSGTIFSPRSKRVVHVSSRYLQSTKR